MQKLCTTCLLLKLKRENLLHDGQTVDMKIVVLHQSRTGNTKRAAELIGGAVQSAGAEVAVRPISNGK